MKTFKHRFVSLEPIFEETTAKGRHYRIPSGARYPSVTTVLSQHSKEGIDRWKSRVGEKSAWKISHAAKTRGTRFHELTEKYLRNIPFTPETSFLEIDAFSMARPLIDRIDNICVIEGGLWSDYLRLAGRVDCIAEFDGVLSVIDFKTSRKKKFRGYAEQYFMQEAAYAVMYEERQKTPIEQLVTIISVEDEHPQLFVEKRKDHLPSLLQYRDLYEGRGVV